jgi:4-amino-4-deoxy-L-arabinose transferase-like glycosyltransferase
VNKKINQLFGLSLLIKLIYALFLPLVFDEYYYSLWGQELSLSYFDHPPMVGWIMNLSQSFSTFAEGAIRWPFIIIGQGTLYIWYIILKDRLSITVLYLFLMSALLNPLWGLGSIIATPDIPLIFFWSLSLLAVKNLLEKESSLNYFLLGFFLGLGFLSKYQMVLFVPALLWLVIQQKKFNLLFNWKVLISIVVGLVTCTPVLVWNFNNDWASFIFQWQHGMSSQKWIWKYPFDYLFSEIILIFPTFLFFYFQKEKLWKKHWLLPFALFPFLFFLYSSFKGRVEGNWPIMAYPATYALAYLFGNPKNLNWMKKTNYLWFLILILVTLLLPFQNFVSNSKIKLFEAEKFAPLIDYLSEDKNYFAYNYQMASYLSFKRKRLICKFPFNGRPDHFNYIDQCNKLPDKFVIISEKDSYFDFKKVLPLYEVTTTQNINDTFVSIEVQKR